MLDFAAKHNITADVEIIHVDYVNIAMARLIKSDGKINTFLVKEQDLQRKNKYLEKTVEILNQNAASFSGHECPKIAIHENYTIKSLGKRGVSDGHTNAESLVFVDGMKPLCEEVDRFKFSSLRKTMEEKLRGAKMKYRKIKFAIRKNKGNRQDDELKYQNSEKQ
ncbi:hypothetical protein POM88_045508 [Heracleum sosnowskyi]|uniref:Uncharacterized protein n=1 Tax=Heracleum sosnowskyi TaxID=360622 RepID=A0AAD8H7E6_9APIA|nr:hypothetical protein POM88_045508 [Heracleum sosnowskyi]